MIDEGCMPLLLPSFLVAQGGLVWLENKQRKVKTQDGGALRREHLQAFEVRGVSVVRAKSKSFERETKSGC